MCFKDKIHGIPISTNHVVVFVKTPKRVEMFEEFISLSE